LRINDYNGTETYVDGFIESIILQKKIWENYSFREKAWGNYSFPEKNNIFIDAWQWWCVMIKKKINAHLDCTFSSAPNSKRVSWNKLHYYQMLCVESVGRRAKCCHSTYRLATNETDTNEYKRNAICRYVVDNVEWLFFPEITVEEKPGLQKPRKIYCSKLAIAIEVMHAIYIIDNWKRCNRLMVAT
jgi:hypothetical protein